MGRTSLRSAINAACRECLFDPKEEGGWREQIEACTSFRCPLYPVRPIPRRRGSQATVTVASDTPQEPVSDCR